MDSKLINSPLRYPGGKQRAISQILQTLPSDFDKFEEFREPFVGGGSVFLAIKSLYPDLKIWINDLNPAVFKFWLAVRDDLSNLVEGIRRLKNKFSSGRELFIFLINEDVDRAVKFFILNRITFSGTLQSGGYSEQAFKTRFTHSSIERLEALEGSLAGLKITNLDFLPCIIKSSPPKTFLFLDPPYYLKQGSKLYGKNGDLHKNFDHLKLKYSLDMCKHQWLMTYNSCSEIKNFYRDYRVKDFTLRYSMSKEKNGKELFIFSY